MKLKNDYQMNIKWISNEYQMAIMQPGFGFVYETDGGKVLLGEIFSQQNCGPNHPTPSV